MTCIPEPPPELQNCGLSHLYWNSVLDRYMETQTLTSKDYEDMSRDQKMVIQELKKHFKRLASR